MTEMNRRALLLAAAGVMAAGPVLGRPDSDAQAMTAAFAELERRGGGRLGVAVRDSQSGATLSWRADERFFLCSTFKLLAVAALLKRVDDGAENLDRSIAYGAGDMVSYAPVTEKHLAEGAMSLRELCAATLIWSDNTAANLILAQLGGPQGVTRFMRAMGDPVTRLDRNEPTLNTCIEGDPRDTTTPNAMLRSVETIVLGTGTGPSTHVLIDWLLGCRTADRKIRAGLKPGWRAGNKTGSGENGTANDVAIVWPPGRKPVLVASYYTQATASPEVVDGIHRDVGRLVVKMIERQPA